MHKIKINANEILDDPKHAPITCKALLNCADEKAEIRASNGADGYDTLPPSGRKIHEYIASLNLNGAQIPKRPARMQNSLYRAVGTSYNDSAGVVYDNWEAIDYDGLDHIAFGIGRSDTDAALVADGYVVRSGIVFTDGGFPSTNSFRTLVTGYYRFTNTMSFSSTVARANIISRFTKSADGNDPFTDFGPTGASAYIRNFAASNRHDNSSTTITDIVHCNAGDYVGVRLTRESNSGVVTTPGGLSNFTAEFLGYGETIELSTLNASVVKNTESVGVPGDEVQTAEVDEFGNGTQAAGYEDLWTSVGTIKEEFRLFQTTNELRHLSDASFSNGARADMSVLSDRNALLIQRLADHLSMPISFYDP